MEFNHLLPLFTRAHYPMLPYHVSVSGLRLYPSVVTFGEIMVSSRIHAVPDVATMPSRLGLPFLTVRTARLISLHDEVASLTIALL